MMSNHCTAADLSESPVNLPFGDVNIVIVTDVHSWVAGHGYHEPLMNINYGDVVSFVDLLKEKEPEKDIFFVMNGDFVDGTGLSVPYPPSHLTPILKFMPWDALTIGNHELYEDVNIQHIREGGFVQHWDGHYLTSNTIMADTKEPIGNRFTYLKGKNTGASILTFGFLYDFENNCNSTEVEKVEDVVESDWFVQELQKGGFDAILVLAHMDVENPLVYLLLDAIRGIVGDEMPIQFVTGHTHYRGFKELDQMAVSFEAGRYLDTIGFASFPIKNSSRIAMMKNDTSVNNATDTNATDATTASLFHHVFLDANIETLQSTLGVDEMTTASGSALSSLIKETRQELGLNVIVGCSPTHYYLEHGLDKHDSLWSLYLNSVVTRHFFRANNSKIMIQSTGSFRYDLFDGNVTMDDVIAVTPFEDDIYKVSERTLGLDILRAFGTPNEVQENVTIINGRVVDLPEYAMTGIINNDSYYDLYTQQISIAFIQERLHNATNATPMTPQQAFHDDGRKVTTLSLWLDFVRAHWSCEDPSEIKVYNRWLLVIFSVAAAIIFFGYRLYRHNSIKRRRQGYDNAVAIEEDDGMIL